MLQKIGAELEACEIRLRAERKAGQLFAAKERAPGKRTDATSGQREPRSTEFQQAKQQAHISDTQAKRWQKLGGIPLH